LNPWEKAIWWLATGLTAAVLVKLFRVGLARIYKLFFCYLAWDFLSSLIGISMAYNTTRYAYFYMGAQTLKAVIAAFLLAEIYSLALEGTPALAQFGRNTVGYILGAAGVFPVLAIFMDHSASRPQPLRTYFFLFEQTMDATMAIFLVLISLFIAWFPVRMRRNVIVYAGGFIVWTLSRSAAVHLANNTNLVATRLISSLQMGISLGCLLFWLIGFRREGESRTAVVGHLWDRAEAERLTQQLDAINNNLERLRRR
jgi:hypothetical protein